MREELVGAVQPRPDAGLSAVAAWTQPYAGLSAVAAWTQPYAGLSAIAAWTQPYAGLSAIAAWAQPYAGLSAQLGPGSNRKLSSIRLGPGSNRRQSSIWLGPGSNRRQSSIGLGPGSKCRQSSIGLGPGSNRRQSSIELGPVEVGEGPYGHVKFPELPEEEQDALLCLLDCHIYPTMFVKQLAGRCETPKNTRHGMVKKTTTMKEEMLLPAGAEVPFHQDCILSIALVLEEDIFPEGLGDLVLGEELGPESLPPDNIELEHPLMESTKEVPAGDMHVKPVPSREMRPPGFWSGKGGAGRWRRPVLFDIGVELRDLVKSFDLVVIWQNLHPDSIALTFVRPGVGVSRINCLYVSQAYTSCVLVASMWRRALRINHIAMGLESHGGRTRTGSPISKNYQPIRGQQLFGSDSTIANAAKPAEFFQKFLILFLISSIRSSLVVVSYLLGLLQSM
eukprot:g46493.t1